jgi:hypothetical protein
VTISLRASVSWLLVAWSGIVASACSGRGGGSAPVIAQMTVDASGGTLAVATGNLARMQVEIPPGALAAPTLVTIVEDRPIARPGYLIVSRAARIEPSDLRALVPIRVTMPQTSQFDTHVIAMLNERHGHVVQLDPTVAVTAGDKSATAPTTGFGTFWVGEIFDGNLRTSSPSTCTGYLPMQTGNTWTFDNGLTITLEETTSEPNFAGMPVFRFLCASAQQDFGFYLHPVTQLTGELSAIDWLGVFSTTGAGFQQQQDPTFFLPLQVVAGQSVDSSYGLVGHEPYGAAAVTYGGVAVTRVTPRHGAAITTAAGEFTDLLHLDFATTTLRTTGMQPDSSMQLVLARGIGPVVVNVFGVRGTLLSATVCGTAHP